MGTIKVSVNDEPLFEWTGGVEKIHNIERELAKVAAPLPLAEFVKAAAGYVAERGRYITSRPDLERMAIIYFIANSPNPHPDHPGVFGDYLPMWDFEFDLRHIEGNRFTVEVIASFAATEGLA